MSINIIAWFPSRIAFLLFLFIFILWAASEVFNTFGFQRYINNNTRRENRISYWIIWVIIWLSFIISFILRINNIGIFQNSIQYLGLMISMLGICLREWAVLTLGKYFTVTISIQPKQKFVKSGPYHWLRHPSYTGSILFLVGFPLAIGTWFAGGLILILSLVGFIYRAKIEEKVLLEAFGNEYFEYMQQTWRLFPGV